jgi:hypothetical protein
LIGANQSITETKCEFRKINCNNARENGVQKIQICFARHEIQKQMFAFTLHRYFWLKGWKKAASFWNGTENGKITYNKFSVS